jgi:hypothetical protein
MTKRFIAQQGSKGTVRVFDASTGNLYKIINVGGDVVSQPIVTESEMSVMVKSGETNFLKTFTLPSGGLKNTVTLSN